MQCVPWLRPGGRSRVALDLAMSLGQVLCVVTGASRGFGLGVCRELGARVAPGSALLMVSRSEETLRQEAERLRERCPGLAVHWVAADLSTEPGLRRTVTAAEEMKSGVEPQTLIIVNNAGSLGDITKRFVDMVDMGEVDGYLSFNVSSALCLTSSMLRSFPGLRSLVVNVSSLAAIKPFRSWALYCAGKAARDMMFRVLAEEEADLRVLSYGPGPLDTDMQEQVRTLTADAELRQLFVNMKNEGKLVDIEMSARKMLDVLLRDTYKSGDHVDFYDDV